jgi:cytoskeletal protein RodZ
MKQTQLDIGTIGQKLKSAREAKGVSVSEAAASTKILSKFIEAMEDDNFEKLSAPVYVKSFVRLYAKYLNLDPLPLIEGLKIEDQDDLSPAITDDVRINLIKTEVSLKNSQIDDDNKKNNPILSKYSDLAKKSINLISKKIKIDEKFYQLSAGIGLLLIIFVIAKCSQTRAIIKNDANINLNVIESPIPNAYLIDKESVRWIK